MGARSSRHSSIDRRRAGLRPLRAARGRPDPWHRDARGAARADRDARGRIGGRLPCAHLTQRGPPCSVAPVAGQGAAGHRERPRALDHAADPLPARRLQLLPGRGALWRSKFGRARCPRACSRPLAARRRAGPHLRRALRRRHLAVSVRRHSQPRTREGNRRAAPAGATALPGADADRRQDDGDLRRLACRAGSRGFGRW